MANTKIGTINGRNIYTGNPIGLREGDYYISTDGNNPTGLYVKKGNEIIPICNCEPKEPVLQDIQIMDSYHGRKQTVNPGNGYDGIGKVSYRKAKLEEKDTVKITENGIYEVKVGEGYDGLDDVTIIVNVE